MLAHTMKKSPNIYTPRWYQDEAEYSIFHYFEAGNVGNPVVAMPTGTGKSIVIASFIKKVMQGWPGQRIMMLTHVKELIVQNAEKLTTIWPVCPLGIYSAGLSSRESFCPVVFGGVQSVAPAIRKGVSFGRRDLLIIDECHLLSDKDSSQYQFVISELKKINPMLKVIGFTATPYRMKMGKITDNGIFTDICYDITGMDSFNRLIAEGYLSPLVARRTQTEIDVSKVDVVAGEYNAKQLEQIVDDDNVVANAVAEMIEYGKARNCWLIFATGIDNCEHIAKVIQSYGLNVQPVHSKLPMALNDRRLKDFRAGKLRGIVSGLKLTTGFDHPPIDFIGDLNPTLSPGKHVQKLGRGTRPYPGKINCLYADFGGNVRRLGPINDPKIPNKSRKMGGDAPIKICDTCQCYNHAAARVCMACGQEFFFETKILTLPDTFEPMRHSEPIVEDFRVDNIQYSIHEKKLKPPSMKITYHCGLQRFYEYVTLEHGGLNAKRARDWWNNRYNEIAPATVAQAVDRAKLLRKPTQIRVWVNKHYPEILSVEYDE